MLFDTYIDNQNIQVWVLVWSMMDEYKFGVQLLLILGSADYMNTDIICYLMNLFVLQLSQQMPSEGGTLQRSAGAVSKGHRNLWTGTCSFCPVERIVITLISSRVFSDRPFPGAILLDCIILGKVFDDFHHWTAAQMMWYTCCWISVCFQVAMSTMDNPLLKYNAKEYFFKASLCHFIVDELNAKVPPASLSLET